MSSKPRTKDGSIKDLISTSEPLTHFFYEREGDCAVSPRLLVENGVTLWHEAVFTNEVYDNSYLWEVARKIVENRAETPMHSWVEWARYRITLGSFVPRQWGRRRPYPYKGLLISAIYLQESRRLCEEGQLDRAWHIIALAYYHLGLNTSRSTALNTSKAAQVMHAGRTEKVRALVLGVLETIQLDGTTSSITAAKDKVVDVLKARNKGLIKDWLNEFDTLVPEKTKGRTEAKDKNDVFLRIRNMLDNWALPSGPYPEIAEAFSRFSKQKPPVSRHVSVTRVTSEDVPKEAKNYFLRLISFTEQGTYTEKLSRNEEEEND